MTLSRPNTHLKFGKTRSHESFLVLIFGLIIMGLFGFFFYTPLFRILHFGFTSNGKVDLSAIGEVFQKATNLRAIRFSLEQAWWSMVICLILGTMISYVIAKYSFPGKKILTSLLTVSFILPSMVILLGFITTFGTGGWVTRLIATIAPNWAANVDIYGTFGGILLAHIFYNLSVVIRMGIPAWQSLDYEQAWVAKSLGVSNWQCFWRIILPQLKITLITAGVLVFMYCFNSFAIVLTLGEARFSTLEVRIFKEIQVNLDFQEASILAFFQLILNIGMIIAYIKFERQMETRIKNSSQSFTTIPVFQKSLTIRQWIGRLLIGGVFLLFCVFLLYPLLHIVILSFTPDRPGNTILSGYRYIFSQNYESLLGTSPFIMLKNTFLFAVLNAGITLLVSTALIFILRNRFTRIRKYRQPISDSIINGLILLPMATSSITLAVGLFLQFRGGWMFENAGWLLIVLAHTLVSVPFATRAMLSAYQSVNVEYLNIASSLGASRLQTFRYIEFPLIKRGFIVALTFAFAISIGEFGATLFLARNQYKTLSLGISTLISTRSYQIPAAMASILVIFTFIAFLIINLDPRKKQTK